MIDRGTVFRTPDGAKSQISVRRDADHVVLTFSRPGDGTFTAKLSAAQAVELGEDLVCIGASHG